jgi:hypothetical protein
MCTLVTALFWRHELPSDHQIRPQPFVTLPSSGPRAVVANTEPLTAKREPEAGRNGDVPV